MQRFTLIATNQKDRHAAFARDVLEGLTSTPKQLSCCYFYDRMGSLLFEAICDLPEYYLTRAEEEILRARGAELVSRFATQVRLVELGSGTAAKTRILIEALLSRQPALRYVPIDICRVTLQESALQLLKEYTGLDVIAIAAEYREGLRHLRAESDGRSPAQLILWLGSNVGNYHRPEAAGFLRQVREMMTDADRLLVGIDLRKDRAVVEPAYDDSQGVTAEFNLNLLTRINRELGGRFDLEAFRHRAVYNEEAGRIEMYLVSTRAQRVAIQHPGLEIEFAAGEMIHTENSYKYSLAEVESLAVAAGLRIECQWLDSDSRFCANLLAPA